MFSRICPHYIGQFRLTIEKRIKFTFSYDEAVNRVVKNKHIVCFHFYLLCTIFNLHLCKYVVKLNVRTPFEYYFIHVIISIKKHTHVHSFSVFTSDFAISLKVLANHQHCAYHTHTHTLKIVDSLVTIDNKFELILLFSNKLLLFDFLFNRYAYLRCDNCAVILWFFPRCCRYHSYGLHGNVWKLFAHDA